jgi:hypothetical protein
MTRRKLSPEKREFFDRIIKAVDEQYGAEGLAFLEFGLDIYANADDMGDQDALMSALLSETAWRCPWNMDIASAWTAVRP